MTDDLPAETKIWRYMTFWKFAAMILGDVSTLWFTRPFKFDDDWEGLCPPDYYNTRPQFNTLPDGERKHHLRAWEAWQRYGFFVTCWHMSDHESAAMWRLYGLAPDGIALQTTVDLIRKCLVGDFNCEVVEYYDPTVSRPIVINDPELIMLTRHDFKWEQEIRVWAKDEQVSLSVMQKRILSEADVDDGKEVLIDDLTTFIQQIVIAPGASPAFEKTVKDLCRATNKHWLTERVQRSAGDRTRDSYLT
jgi:hypothetical protein